MIEFLFVVSHVCILMDDYVVTKEHFVLYLELLRNCLLMRSCLIKSNITFLNWHISYIETSSRVTFILRSHSRMANSNNDLVVPIRLLAEKLTQERAERPDTAWDIFERLTKIKPPYYKGIADPTFLENQIREFEKIFGAVNCHEGMRVDQVVLYLKDEADLWRGNRARLSVVEGFT